MEDQNELVQVITESGVEQTTALTLQNSFMPFFEKANEWKLKAESLVVTDVSQVREMKMAREARLALKEIRVNADKTRKLLKEDSTRYGKAVQSVYNMIEFLISPIELHLEKQEKFAEIQEANRKAKLRTVRESEVLPYREFVPYGIDFGEMTDEDYLKLINGAILQHDAKIEADKKAERERIEKEKAEREEQERIRLENERLKAEAKQRQMESEAERQRNAEIYEKERAERQKLEKELKEKQDAERKQKEESERKAKEWIEQQRKESIAPDKEKLFRMIESLELEMPDFADASSEAVFNVIKTKFEGFQNWAKSQINLL